MDSTGYLPLAAALGVQRGLDVTANNLANGATAGYRAGRVVFEELLVARPQSATPEDAAYSQAAFSYIDQAAGPLSQTGNPLDIALQGEGYFAYQTAAGQIGYSRAGRLVMDNEGVLRNPMGDAILDAGGGEIILDPLMGLPNIAKDGSISDNEGNNVGQIGIFAADIQHWEALGEGLYSPREGAPDFTPQEGAKLVQGASEGSNVNPIAEMVRLIELQRQFDLLQNASKTHNELRQGFLSRLGQKA